MVSTILSIAAVEIFLSQTKVQDPEFYNFDDFERGWRLNAGLAGWWEDENHVWVTINSAGLRDREHPLIASPGSLRIAVLGDSFMEAMNLPFERSFVPQLERRLSGCLETTGRIPEVINFGVRGYSPAQEWLTYRSDVFRYKPDIVLQAVFTENDIVEDHPAFSQSDRPYFRLRDGQLERFLPVRPPEDDYSHLPWYQRVRLAFTDRFRSATLVWNAWGSFRAAFFPVIPTHEDDDPVLAPPHGDLTEAWSVTEAVFQTLAREVADHGSEFWITTLSNAEQTNPDLAARAALANRLGVSTLYYPDDRIRDFAHARNIPVISLAQPLADYSARTGKFLNGGYNAAFPAGTGHWNETAHELAADIVAKRLCADSRVIAEARSRH